MELIIEAGGTSSSFYTLKGNNISEYNSSGFNPNSHTWAEFNHLLSGVPDTDFSAVHYYGAGAGTPGIKNKIKELLAARFNARLIHIHSDLLGAARACLGHSPGLIAILGTGTSIARYDGQQLHFKTLSGGFLIGDPGSGFELGRKLALAWLSDDLPEILKQSLESYCGADALEFRNRVYASKTPVRDIADLCKWAGLHRNNPEILRLIEENFIAFREHLFSKFPEAGHLPVGFCGSIAFHFKEILTKTLSLSEEQSVTFLQKAGPGLCQYHAKL
jgi:glucosamine kinase